MALVTYNRTNIIQRSLSKILTNNGYISINDAPFLGEIVGAINSALTGKYNQVYEIANNVDIGRANGEYLDRWGKFLDEPRDIPNYATDMSLTNVYIELDPNINAGQLTTDGAGITIPEGTIISTESGDSQVQTLDDTYIGADRSRAYCRVSATDPGVTYVSPGTLVVVDYNLNNVGTILPSSILTYSLVANNAREITGGVAFAEDDTYQFVLSEKAKSVGLFNENKVNSILDVDDVISIYIDEYIGGAIIYLDTADPILTEAVVTNARQVLQQYRTLGQSVQVYTPIIRRLQLKIQVEVKNKEYIGNTSATIKSHIINNIITSYMGDSVQYTEIVNGAKNVDENIIGIRILESAVDGRTLTSGYIPLHYNERISIAEGDITII